jgi:2-aminoadipate transaminase
MPRLAQLKLNSDLHTATLPQLIAAEFLSGEGYDAHIASSNELYRERRDALLDSLDRHLAPAATWTVPNGGHHVWLTFDRPVDERLLYAEALREGVSFVPGGATQPEPTPRTSIRLSFGMFDAPRLEEGVVRLTRALAHVMRRDRVVAMAPIS